MTSPFRALLTKEVKVIFRDPAVIIGTILIPVLIFPLMGSAFSVSEQAARDELAHLEIGLLSLDGQDGNATYGDAFYALMVASNLTVRNATASTTDGTIEWALANGIDTIVVLPLNFTETIAAGRASNLSVFQALSNFGPAELAGSQTVDAVVDTFNAIIASDRARQTFPNSTAAEALYPARTHTSSIIRGEVRNVHPEAVVNTILGGSIMLPIIISIMIVVSAQLAATSVASEKEEKTLEVLLTLPTRRENILLGKLAGVFIVALIGTVSIVVGFGSYTSQLAGSLPSADPAASGLVPDMQGYALLVITLLMAFVSALCLAVLVAAYAKDIYGAQSLMSVVYLPVFLPSILTSFTPVEILPPVFQGLIYGIPFSYPGLAGKALYTHEYGTVYFGIAYQLVFMAVVLYLAARMFSTEKVLTARLSFGRKKRKGTPRDD